MRKVNSDDEREVVRKAVAKAIASLKAAPVAAAPASRSATQKTAAGRGFVTKANGRGAYANGAGVEAEIATAAAGNTVAPAPNPTNEQVASKMIEAGHDPVLAFLKARRELQRGS